MSEAFHIDGLAELEKALKTLGERSSLQVAKAALRDAAGEIRKEMRSAVKVKSGTLRASIRVAFDRKSRDNPAVLIGPGQSGWYGRLLEKGTKAHRIPNKTVGRGRNKRDNSAKAFGGKVMAFNGKVVASVIHPGIAPRPWAEPAFMRSYPRALEKLKQRLAERIIVEAYRKARVR